MLLLLLLAIPLVVTVYCLRYICEYGLLLLAIHTPQRLAATCYLLWSFLTKENVVKKRDIFARCNIYNES